MSTVQANNLQVGSSGTASNNFTIYQPASPDGTVRIGNGNSGSPTEVAQFTSGGDFKFNSGYGSVATAYGCRAWVNFNGTGTVAISASGNVSSITDNNTGDYTVNFTNAMADANYSVVGIVGNTGSASFGILTGPRTTAPTTTAYRFLTTTATPANTDYPAVQLAVFR